MILQSTFLIKTSILVFTIAAGCLMRLWNIKKLTCWHPKVVVILIIWIPCHFFIFLLSFNFLRKRKNHPCLKIILTSISFVVYILYRFLKPQNRVKSCFIFQFFTHDTIEITNVVNISFFQSELSFFVISKFRFKNDNSLYPLLLLLLLLLLILL